MANLTAPRKSTVLNSSDSQALKGFKMIIESKDIDLLKLTSKNETKKEPTIVELWENYCLKLDKKEANAKKRALNPTIPKLVSDQKRIEANEYKSNAKTVLIGTKNLLKKVVQKDLNEFENMDFIKKANALVNYITSVKNMETLNLFLTFATPTKNGFYTESNFSNLIQAITKISITKNKDFKDSINYFEATKKTKK
jgi:hypothetical protein